MRKRDPGHQAQFDALKSMEAGEVIRRLRITDYRHSEYVASEVISRLVRERFNHPKAMGDAAGEALVRRIYEVAGRRFRGFEHLPHVDRLGNRALSDITSYIEDKVLVDTAKVSNCEVRFAIFVQNRFDEFIRHLGAQKNSMASIDSMVVMDEEGNQTSLSDHLVDESAEDPLEALERNHLTARVLEILMSLPEVQRNAFYYRAEFEYEWDKIAELLRCSKPTARKHYRLALEQLKGAL